MGTQTKISYNPERIQCDTDGLFKSVSQQLLNEYRLVIREKEFLLTEIEFYAFSKTYKHEDDTCYRKNKPIRPESWYKHASGLDLTLDSKPDLNLGVLIRSIVEIKQEGLGEYIYGPLKSLKTIMCIIPESEFMKKLNGNCFDPETEFYLAPNPYNCPENEEVFNCPRHGLPSYKEYYLRPYRFFTFPQKKHAGKETVILPYLANHHEDYLKTLPEKFGRRRENLEKFSQGI